MTLHNPTVDPATLDQPEPMRLTAVAPRYAAYRVLGVSLRWVIAGLVLALAVMPGAELEGAEAAARWWPLLVAGLAVLHVLVAWREARARAWGLREHDLVYRSGLVVRRTMVLPFNRIQHVETLSGPLERAFGLLRVVCYTAGGLSADLVVSGLEQPDAERVRQYLLGRIRDLDPDTPEPTSARLREARSEEVQTEEAPTEARAEEGPAGGALGPEADVRHDR